MPCSYCGEPKILARGLCGPCYHRLRKRGTLERKNLRRQEICSVEGCARPVDTRNLCSLHYAQADDPRKIAWKLLRTRYPDQFPASWQRFESFAADVGEKPGKNFQLRRIDPREPYSAENIHWLERTKHGRRHGMSRDERLDYAREWKLTRHYGITGEDYDRMFKEQGGKCAICGEAATRRLAVDHDHQTGRVRGLLCRPCNNGLGHFKDARQRLQSAIAYLERSLT